MAGLLITRLETPMSKARRRGWVTGAKVTAMLAGIAGSVLGTWIAQPDRNTSAESWGVFFTHIDRALAGSRARHLHARLAGRRAAGNPQMNRRAVAADAAVRVSRIDSG